MDNRYEIAEQNGMSREFADWFFDNKKAGCGNVWFMMMAAMWEGWQGRAAMLQGAEPVTTAYKLRDAVETIRNSGIEIDAEKIFAERDALNSPVIPDGWVACSERMPNDKDYVWCWGRVVGWTEDDGFEAYYDATRNKWWAVTMDGEEPVRKVTHWMPLPAAPQHK